MIIVNEFDVIYTDKTFKVVLGNTFFKVHADNEQDALDTVVDHAEGLGYTGLFLSDEEVQEFETEGWDYVTTGNHCLSLDISSLYIQEESR